MLEKNNVLHVWPDENGKQFQDKGETNRLLKPGEAHNSNTKLVEEISFMGLTKSVSALTH